jgi:hypothetical protein
MKKLISIPLFIFLTVFVYLSFSFISWELNPQIWKIETRGGFIFFMVMNLTISMAYKSLQQNI